ncbi:high affinity immunoglobulin epsilon receptor subunit gamma [Aulostomus maculatus]
MAVSARSLLLVAVPLWMSFGGVAALKEPELCYILDGVLFLYGIILTVLYCRLKVLSSKKAVDAAEERKQIPEEGIYTDLAAHVQDVYESIGMKK